jgi:hypothetical protein
MAATPRSFTIAVYAPALVGDDERPLAIVHGFERALPGLRLEWTLSEKGRFIALTHRDEWVAADRADGGFPFLCNDDEISPVTLTGWENPSGLAMGSPPRLEVHATLPRDAAGIAAAMNVLDAIGEGAHGVWGHASPDGHGQTVARQFHRPDAEPHAPPHGLPSLKLPRDNPAPEIPHYLGWLNYWSVAATRAIGFPDPVRDADLLSRSRRTASGGWVVRLTEAPLDLDNPAHLDALKRAYERFPEIGGRTVP